MRSHRAAWPVAAIGAALVIAASASGAFPGRNGDIAVLSTRVDHIAGTCRPSATQACSPDDRHVVLHRALVFVAVTGTVHTTRAVAPSAGAFTGSPDGTRLAFTEGQRVYVSDLNGRHRRLVASSGGQPAWAPDGRRLAFVNNSSVWVIGVNGRGRRLLASGRRDSSPSWSPDARTIVFIQERHGFDARCSSRSDLFTVPAAGGRARLLFRPALRCGLVDSVDWAPGGSRLVVTVGDGTKPSRPPDPGAAGLVGITVLRSNGTRLRRLLNSGTAPVWSPNGQEIAFFGQQCRQSQDTGRALCDMAADGGHLKRVTAVRDDMGAGFGPTWLVRRP
jgi:dipeptidyl aminopeptidase/acylaminoacyl peptidase